MVIIYLVLLGLCLGSFINALVWRIHQQETKKTKHKDLSILKGRSMCTRCGHTLEWSDLTPVFSWILLKGKCRYCKAKISFQYPLVEVLTAALFIISYYFWPLNFNGIGLVIFGLWLLILTLLIALFVYDLKWMILPDRIVYPLIGLSGLFAVLNLGNTGDFSMLILSVTIAGGIFELLYMFSSGKWIGGGDAKLGVALGLILMRPDYALLMIFIASLIGTLAAVPSILNGKYKNVRIPFGPCLITATLVVFFFGEHISNWYLNLLLFT